MPDDQPFELRFAHAGDPTVDQPQGDAPDACSTEFKNGGRVCARLAGTSTWSCAWISKVCVKGFPKDGGIGFTPRLNVRGRDLATTGLDFKIEDGSGNLLREWDARKQHFDLVAECVGFAYKFAGEGWVTLYGQPSP